MIGSTRKWMGVVATGIACACAPAWSGAATAPMDAPSSDIASLNVDPPRGVREAAVAPKHVDRSGRTRVGKASFYARFFAGRKMADGNRMDPQGNNAASKTLPLGTVAKVTNLATGQSAIVKIQDRGPYVPGRIVDLSPTTAQQVGIGPKEGVAPVKVEPLILPPDVVADARERPGAR